VFDGQGRAVCSHEGNKVKFYDGQQWYQSRPVPENDLYRRHPFLRDGKVVVVGKKGTYEGAPNAETGTWDWTEVAPFLRDALKQPDPEVSTRARQVIETVSQEP